MAAMKLRPITAPIIQINLEKLLKNGVLQEALMIDSFVAAHSSAGHGAQT
jgi:hypothetical protein